MTESKTERQLLEDISAKLDKLLGFVAIAGREQGEQIKILRGLNFEWSDIGTMVGLKADAARKRFNAPKNDAGKSKRNKKQSKGGV
jgi:hypothetical protein